MTAEREKTPLQTSLNKWAFQRNQTIAMDILPDQPLTSRWTTPFYCRFKRIMDITLGIMLLLAVLPVIILVAIAIKLTSPGPILFRQHRAGKNGKPFYMLKFRSMHLNAEHNQSELKDLNELTEGPCFKIRNDPRLTFVGRLIRRTSIDELPQLFNVLKGEMSLVGPRPLPLPEVNNQTRAERARLSVTPGLTCLWQISGRSKIPYNEWMQLDLYYVENRNLLLDLEILVKTIPAVLSCRGAF
jgi:lipopolysaccharide/colanic/teichoic acid biosynthesis glycosyltransferase